MRLLVFTAHPDDEIACLAMIEKIRKSGEVLLVCFTAENEARLKEFEAACKFLKIKGINLGLEDGMIIVTKKIKENLVEIIRKFKPDIVICQSDEDYHPDHKKVFSVAKEVVEFARRKTDGWKVKEFMKWESVNLFTNPEIIMGFDETVMKKKKKLWQIHKSQIKSKKAKTFYLNFLEYRSRLRGTQIGKKYGEAYKRIPLPVHGDFY